MGLEIGQAVDQKYRVVRLIGQGGMGAVYEGENVRIKRRVAIKTLHAQFSKNHQVVTRFEHEAQAAGRIGSDHILEVIDLGTLPDGDRFMVMEFLDGESLAQRIQRFGRLTVSQLVPVVRQVLEGLSAAHGAGIIHRDLKPDNIFILKNKAGIADFVKIIDFGISKFHNAEQGAAAMTQAGSIMGTPLYMSPEQANGSSEADARSDLYAIGIIMYEALAGAPPFNAQNLNELLFKIVLSDIPRLDTVVPSCDPNIAAVVARATAKKREDRFGSALEMMAALDFGKTSQPGAISEVAGAAPLASPGGTVAIPTPVRTPPLPPGNTPAPFPGQTPGRPLHATPWPVPEGPVPTRTDGAWGQVSAPPPARSKAPLIAGLGLASVVLLAGAGFTASKVLSPSRHAPPAPADVAGSTSAAAASQTSEAVVLAPPADLPAASAPPAESAVPASPTTPVPAVAPTEPPKKAPAVRASPATPRSTAPPPKAPKPTKSTDWGY